MKNHCDLKVPTELLAMSDAEGGDGMATPSKGDSVSLSVDAEVIGDEGGKAMLKIKSINGQPYKASEGEEMDEEAEPTREGLLARAQALDNAPV